jgi:hypothetical protein
MKTWCVSQDLKSVLSNHETYLFDDVLMSGNYLQLPFTDVVCICRLKASISNFFKLFCFISKKIACLCICAAVRISEA